MSNRKITILMPEYMRSFKCIGSACEDTCCRGWRIEVDRETYQKYGRSNHELLKPMFELFVKEKENAPNDSHFASIELDQDKKCPFLDQQFLCEIHKHLGEDYLSKTCWSYPRIHNLVDENAERIAVLSCPEVVRKALFNPDGMVFNKYEMAYSSKDAVVKCIETKTASSTLDLVAYFWEIRIASLSILQNRKYGLDQRLTLLGMLYQNIEELKATNALNYVPELISTFEEMINNGEFNDQLSEVTFEAGTQIDVIRILMSIKKTHGISGVRYLNAFNETVEGLGLDQKEIDPSRLNFKYFNDYKQTKEFVLENYLVNEFFREVMPFGRYENIWEAYMFLCIIFSMVKIHLIGISHVHEGLTDSKVVEVVQSISKEVAHNEYLFRQFIDVIRSSGFNTLQYMSTLTKYPE